MNHAHLADRETFVYRCFDSDGNLLYVGMTVDLTTRLKQHHHGSDWFPNVANVEAEIHPDRPTAAEAEAAAIALEAPRHNAPPRPLVTLPPISFARPAASPLTETGSEQ